MLVEMNLQRVLIRETDDTHVVELREKNGVRLLPIMIGYSEAKAIERRLLGNAPPRPMTHELMDAVLVATGHEVQQVVITELAGQTFHAELGIAQDGQMVHLDARPSDAIALACSHSVPIYATESVLEVAGV